MDQKFIKLTLGFASLLILCAAAAFLWQVTLQGYGSFEFRFHKSNYERIAGKMTVNELQEGKLSFAYVEDLKVGKWVASQPQAKELPRGKGRGNVWASLQNGQPVVWIEVLDNGHAGEFGYAWSASGQAPIWKADAWGEFWSLGKQLDDHWWKVEYLLG